MGWNIDCIKTLENKRILVTGGNSGLGFESVKMFASKGAEVIIAVRSIKRGETAIESIKSTYPNANIRVMALDLSSKDSIYEFSEVFHKNYKSLDVLLNNAGIMTTPYGLTKDGLEQQQGVNHFGHFLLTGLLFDIIKNTMNSRIVSVSSLAHKYGASIDFKNLLYENGKGYKKAKAYSRSKLENLLFIYELDRRVKAKGYNVKVVAAHPGVSKTNLGRHIKKSWMDGVINVFQKFFSHPAFNGAMPQVRASLCNDVKSGEFYGPDKFMQFTGHPVVVKSSKLSHNEEIAKELWDLSEQLMDFKFEV